MKYILFLVAIVAITCAETEDVFDLDKFRIKLPKLTNIIKVVKPLIPIVKSYQVLNKMMEKSTFKLIQLLLELL